MSLKIVRGVQRSAIRGTLYGPEGIGKTTLAAQWPNPVILDTEDGSKQIDCAKGFCRDWVTLLGAMLQFAGDSQGFETVVIDSVDWAETLLRAHLEHKLGKPVEDLPYGRGFGVLAENFSKLLSAADSLIDKGIHVLFVGHSAVKRCTPPDMEEGYDRYELKLSKQVGPLVKEWADLMLFANYRTKVVDGSDGRKKARGGKERVLYAERSAALDAKNRFGLPPEMPMEIKQLWHLFEPEKKKTLRERIAEASSVAELGELGDLVDDQASKGKLTPEQVATLEAAIAFRHGQLEPEAVHG